MKGRDQPFQRVHWGDQFNPFRLHVPSRGELYDESLTACGRHHMAQLVRSARAEPRTVAYLAPFAVRTTAPTGVPILPSCTSRTRGLDSRNNHKPSSPPSCEKMATPEIYYVMRPYSLLPPLLHSGNLCSESKAGLDLEKEKEKGRGERDTLLHGQRERGECQVAITKSGQAALTEPSRGYVLWSRGI